MIGIKFDDDSDAEEANNVLGEVKKAVVNIYDDDAPSMFGLLCS